METPTLPQEIILLLVIFVLTPFSLVETPIGQMFGNPGSSSTCFNFSLIFYPMFYISALSPGRFLDFMCGMITKSNELLPSNRSLEDEAVAPSGPNNYVVKKRPITLHFLIVDEKAITKSRPKGLTT